MGMAALSKGKDDFVIDSLVVLISVFVVVIVCYPLIFVISSSVSDPLAVTRGEVVLLPKGFTFEGYQKIFQYKPIWIGYRNTFFYTILGTLINLGITLPAAYALSRRDLPGRVGITLIFTLTMFFNGGLIPTYLVYKQFYMINTIWVMLIPGAISMWYTIICRTYFQTSIPMELQESAYIDGCSDFGIFAKIILPLSNPIIAVLTLFYAVGHWNSFFNALIYLTRMELYPLQLFLRNILIQDQMLDMIGLDDEMIQQLIRQLQLRESMKFGIIVISSVPMLALYPFLQKYFVKGVMIGAIKG
jgi:putative aldouronate transport system permease protein